MRIVKSMVMLPGTWICLLVAATVAADEPTKPSNNGWVLLFNGKDLTGWETSLGVPPGEKKSLGRNNDPKKVFQVVQEDGEPAIRISGELVGGLTTLKEFENYHLQLEFKWGEKRFAPRAKSPRDSGIFYHGQGDYDASTGWFESVQFGLLEGGETGDFWNVGGALGTRIRVDVEAADIAAKDRRYPEQSIRFKPGGRKHTAITASIANGKDNEKPVGQWNRLELICVGQTSVHVVNGTANLVLTNIRRNVNGREESLSRGRIQLQSEGAEVHFRRLRMKAIPEIPAEYRPEQK
jgi:3-keto-disaccharide hydrolase